MQMQETLTGSTFDHLFSFLLSLTVSLSQKLKNLTIFNFAQILHANSHPGVKQLCQILEESVKNLSSYAPPKSEILPRKSDLTAMSRQSLINNSSNN